MQIVTTVLSNMVPASGILWYGSSKFISTLYIIVSAGKKLELHPAL